MKIFAVAIVFLGVGGAALSPVRSRSEAASTGIQPDAGSLHGNGSAIVWAKSFKAAKARAERERKPILLLHLFGRLDEDLC